MQQGVLPIEETWDTKSQRADCVNVSGRVVMDPVGDGGNVFIPEGWRSVQLGGDLGDLFGGHVAGEAELTEAVGDEVGVRGRGAFVDAVSG
ncbi:hypothetical protein ABIB49_002991 [Arthrobacter sp. UYCu512]